MGFNRHKRISLFMMDSTENEGNKEAVMDFVVSWTLRMSVCYRRKRNKKLHEYCRNFLSLLLGRAFSRKTNVVKVETWKQYRGIDLWVQVILEENGNLEQHEILIEDKVYSPLRNNQLKIYRKVFDDYLDKNFSQATRHYLLLTCYESWDSKINRYDEALKLGFKVIPWDEMITAMFKGKNPIYAENDIFNEFWINRWA